MFYDGSAFVGSTAPELYAPLPETTGRAIEGKDGVLEIVLQPEFAGKTLKDVYATSRRTYMPVLPYFGRGSADLDRAPDGTAFGKPFTAVECPTAAPTTTPHPTDPGQQGQSGQPGQPGQPGGNGQAGQQGQPGQPAPTPTPTPGPLKPGSPLPVAGTLTADVAADKGKRKTARKRGLRARVRCSVQCKVTAVAKIDKTTARRLRLGKKAVTIAKGSATITKAGRRPFFLKLSKKAKKALKRKGRKFAIRVTFTVADAQGKQLKKVTRNSTLR